MQLLPEGFNYPSPMLVFTFVMLSYFIVTAGIAYDIINEPPAVGGVPDPVTGRIKPQAFMPYRINGQYIMEGLCGGMFYTLGGVGLVLLAQAQERGRDKMTRGLCRALGAALSIISFATCMSFIRIKMPGYMR
uniref:Oligosaccharyltransferase complex subunit n=1 Tax=Chlamydomonas leiostraca TaxID=1034604 RepID=A0A7S0R262_9CHLO|mmetsp:Transcript_12025/g.29383  ORF Transcript_12025/g.29383 Transcript_12025/m.29383 type:complete len:133 (+) Transcript_12025:91-489(+)|eukprot:CAMPEP_0202860876 /NCGR_PEP_ID=MMETSP1391-20130828/2457_1 /ASSEMBLY_ACC=CAM_ASM_000867 /TAXON_ID=1034604 /ORGANISM="Chlamydomonas leiostraca, Strain SAG 11-49" /LENGTH=132 /DNA_ID=CAMNT_0049540157 /DNA_START=88 /DNA_END=486 /DNA_ORIENTATION=+